jgi:hypothetical protein
MGYWPFGKLVGGFWATYDNNINFTKAMHMLYLSYVRLRSIEEPTNYLNEFLCKRPSITMCCFWIFGIGFYMPMCFIFGIKDFSPHINFNSKYLGSFFNFITWFLPLVATAIVSWIFVKKLSLRTRRRKFSRPVVSRQLLKGIQLRFTRPFLNEKDNKENEFSFNTEKETPVRKINEYIFYLKPTTRFKIVIFSFWTQWIIPFVINSISYLVIYIFMNYILSIFKKKLCNCNQFWTLLFILF